LAALAHHFRAAGNTRNAIQYSIAAADAAETVFAYEDALSHLRPALAMAESHDLSAAQRAAVLLRLGRIIVFFENHEQGVAYLESASRIFEQIGDYQRAGEVHALLGCLFSELASYLNIDLALIHLQKAEILLERSNESSALGMLYWGLALAYREAMRTNESLTASQRGMDIFARLKDHESWAKLAGYRAGLLMSKGRLVQAVDLYNEVARVGARFDDPDAFSHVAFLCGFFRFSMRDPIGAIRWYQIGLNKPGHDLKLRGHLLVFLNQSEIFAGNLAKAKQQAGEIVNPTFRMLTAYFQGDWKAAREGLQTALDWAQQVGTKYQELNTLSYGVGLMRAIGDYAGAAAAHERALSFYQPDDQVCEVRLRPQGVMLCFDTGQPEKAAQHLNIVARFLRNRRIG
jgi:tetratricopeptide (TPR) repeat protein